MLSGSHVLQAKSSGRTFYLPLTIQECGLLSAAKAARDHIQRCAPCDAATASMVWLSDVSHAAKLSPAVNWDPWVAGYMNDVIKIANQAYKTWAERTKVAA